jgi:CRP/FNR family cyclic AMP-dependent transcriptional regulator
MTPTVDGSIGASRVPPPRVQDAGWMPRELGKGEALYRAGDVGGTVYWVDEGLLKLTIEAPGGKERILALAGPGDILGALGAQEAGFQETAEALSQQALVRSTPRARLLPDSADQLLAAAALHVARMRHALEDIDLPVAVRVARTLVRLGCRFGQRTHEGELLLTLPLTHEHLGAMIGAARETTSTALGEIRAAGLLKGTRGRYRFHPRELERFVSEAAFG